MSAKLNIHSLGYVANNNPARASRDGAEYKGILPSPAWKSKVVKRNATVEQTVSEMKKLIKETAWQTKKLSEKLRGNNIYATCGNIWKFLFSHIKYKEDDEGEEQLREPALSWFVRTIRGIDCDDFSIFASSILYNLGIPHYFRIARYQEDYFQHVYVVVPQTANKYIVIDAVLDGFDMEKEPTETKDFLVMSNNNLNGINVSVLSGIDDDILTQISGILSGADFEETDQMEGLGQTPDREKELEAIYNHLVRTRNSIAQNPALVQQTDNPENLLTMLDYAIKYWNTDKRDEALHILETKEEELNQLNGLGNAPEGFEEVYMYYGVEGLGGAVALGKIKIKKGFFNKVKQAVQKAGQGIKKAAQAVVKYNPVFLGIRAGILIALKTNFLHFTESMKWGYLTEAEARENDLDMDEWSKMKSKFEEAKYVFVHDVQGDENTLKHAVITGRGGGLSGYGDLGIVAAAAAGTSLATAMPFITKMLNFFKDINFKKMLAKVKANKLARKKKKAEAEVEEEKNKAASEEENKDSNPDGTNDTKDKEKQKQDNKNNLPANTDNKDKENGSNDTAQPTDDGFFTKIGNWVKANKFTTAALVGGTIYGIYYLNTHKKKRGLSGVRKKGKKHKGAKKTKAPKTISGTGKYKKKKPKVKTKKITL